MLNSITLTVDMRSAFKIVILNVIAFLALVLLVEGGVRLFYPDIAPQNLDANLFLPFKYGETYGYKPNARGREFGAVYVTDEHGFRVDPTSTPSQSDRIMVVLGDSVSAGIGVSADQIYPSLLANKFPSRRVVNASVTGYGIADYVAALRAILRDIKPEGVIIAFCLNDTVATSQAMIQKRKATGESIPDKIRYPNPVVRWLRYVNDNYLDFNPFLRTYSRTYLLIKSLATDTSRDYFLADYVSYQQPQTLDLLTTEFVQLNELAIAYNFPLVVFVFPYEYQLRATTRETHAPQRVIQEAGGKSGLKIYDLFDDLREYLASNGVPSHAIYLFNDPMHFNERGHRVIAELMYRGLQKSGL